ncbi:MAG: Gfo/Idh/MocA family protein, partial [Bacilli bacterium]
IIDPSKVKKFVGWDNLDQVLAEDVDLVVEATPPVFRTPHYEKIVAAGKHAFLEKPGAVDVEQGRKMYALAKEAEKKGLCVVCGNQRRYDNRYQDMIKRMQDGEIGELLSGQCYWNNGGYIGAWANGRKELKKRSNIKSATGGALFGRQAIILSNSMCIILMC